MLELDSTGLRASATAYTARVLVARPHFLRFGFWHSRITHTIL